MQARCMACAVRAAAPRADEAQPAPRRLAAHHWLCANADTASGVSSTVTASAGGPGRGAKVQGLQGQGQRPRTHVAPLLRGGSATVWLQLPVAPVHQPKPEEQRMPGGPAQMAPTGTHPSRRSPGRGPGRQRPP